MELEILKFICANQGAFLTEELLCNLGNTPAVTEIIKNEDKFACCCPFGQPKVVARTKLRLCRRPRDCPGSCCGLHVCQRFLIGGSCLFRRGCSFSHDLHSPHNLRMLKQHGLEGLSRTELSTLLLQSDNRILPPICYDYNNSDGEFGRCKDGSDCKRLHICEKFLNRHCTCSRCHDFYAVQPLKALKGFPAELFGSLKPIYANKQALKYLDSKNQVPARAGHLSNRGASGSRWRQGVPRPLQRKTHSTTDLHYGSDLCKEKVDSENSEGSESTMPGRNPQTAQDVVKVAAVETIATVTCSEPNPTMTSLALSTS